nr:hypothetical protein [Spirosoma utsteinense]
MVEQKFGYELVDSLLLTADLPSGGAYTSAGTYPPHEMSGHYSKPAYESAGTGCVEGVWPVFISNVRC